MVFDLTKTAFDIITMEDNIVIRVGDAKVPNAAVDARKNVAITTVELTAKRSTRHVVHSHGVGERALFCVEDLARRLSRMKMDVLWSKEAMRKVAPDPVWKAEGKIVLVLFQHVLGDELTVA